MDPIRECLCLGRRQFLTGTAGGIGAAALVTLLKEDRLLAAATFAPRARRCIFFFMEGGPSQLDLFSYKPKLNLNVSGNLNGKTPPAEYLAGSRFAFIQKD